MSSKYYFTSETERAILDYLATDDRNKKSELYVKHIQPAFHEMVEKIVYTYKFGNLPNIEDLKEDCKLWIITILDKFDVSKNKKAFTYFSIITKNWFIFQTKKAFKENKNENLYKYQEYKNLSDITRNKNYIEKREEKEFWISFFKELKSWNGILLKDNDKIVHNALCTLFDNIDNFDDDTILSKKAIYFYIRELTGLNTKQIATSLKKIKIEYLSFKARWNSGEI